MLDIVAYHGATNEIRVVECKSLLDSPGVDEEKGRECSVENLRI